MKTRDRFLRTALAVLLGAALVLGATACTSDPQVGANGDWGPYNKTRKGYVAADVAKAKSILGRVNSAMPCNRIAQYTWSLIFESYTKGKMPMALGAANCESPRDPTSNAGIDTEDILVEVYGTRPNALDFVKAKAKRICARAKALSQSPDSKLKFEGIPYVMSADKTWVVEPDSFGTARQIGKIFGRPAQDMCTSG